MASFDLGSRFSLILCAFGTFHHLRTVEQQLGCLASCRRHLQPNGSLVVDLINPDPAPRVSSDGEPDGERADDMSVEAVEWTAGRRVRGHASIIGCDRLLQCNDCEVTYEVFEADGTTRSLVETFPMRMVFRYELEHLLARCGFRVTALYGDYDRSPFSEESLGMIVVAEPVTGGVP
jgi:SAM-dependent methyltransferase